MYFVIGAFLLLLLVFYSGFRSGYDEGYKDGVYDSRLED